MIACQLLFSKSTFLYISPIFPFSLNMLFSIYAFLYKCLLPYLLHIHNSAAPRLCIFAYTILSSDVRHYYTIPRAMLNYLKVPVVLCKRLVKVCYKLPLYKIKRLVKACYKFYPIYRFLKFFCESFSRFSLVPC